jgi:hypothetical protein
MNSTIGNTSPSENFSTENEKSLLETIFKETLSSLPTDNSSNNSTNEAISLVGVEQTTHTLPPEFNHFSDNIKALIFEKAEEYGLNPIALAGLINAESSGREHPPTSSAGAEGIMQVLPTTFNELKREGLIPQNANIHNPSDNIDAAMALMQRIIDNLQQKYGLTSDDIASLTAAHLYMFHNLGQYGGERIVAASMGYTIEDVLMYNASTNLFERRDVTSGSPIAEIYAAAINKEREGTSRPLVTPGQAAEILHRNMPSDVNFSTKDGNLGNAYNMTASDWIKMWQITQNMGGQGDQNLINPDSPLLN